jgi:hypothetical protein
MSRPRRPAIDRFKEKIEIDESIGMWLKTETDRPVWEPCWIWTGCRTPAGYGQFKAEPDKRVQAHNFSYDYYVGPLDPRLVRDHLCHNPACVNYKHLEQVTNRENSIRAHSPRMEAYRNDRCLQGHPFTYQNTLVSYKRRTCRICFYAYQAVYYQKNREKILARKREYQRQNYQKNKARIDARKKAGKENKYVISA